MSLSVSPTMLKTLTVWIMADCGKILERQEHQTILFVSWETCMWFKEQQNPVWNNWLVQDRERNMTGLSAITQRITSWYSEHIMRNAGLNELQARIKIGGRNINNLRYADDTTLMAESKEELKNILMRVKEGSETAGLKLILKKKDHDK